MRILINVPEYELRRLQEDCEETAGRRPSLRKLAHWAVNNLIERYLSTEYISPEDILGKN